MHGPTAINWYAETIIEKQADYVLALNGHAASNFALVEKTALNLLKTEDSKNMSIKSKRLVAAWDNEFLLKVLGI